MGSLKEEKPYAKSEWFEAIYVSNSDEEYIITYTIHTHLDEKPISAGGELISVESSSGANIGDSELWSEIKTHLGV